MKRLWVFLALAILLAGLAIPAAAQKPAENPTQIGVSTTTTIPAGPANEPDQSVDLLPAYSYAEVCACETMTNTLTASNGTGDPITAVFTYTVEGPARIGAPARVTIPPRGSAPVPVYVRVESCVAPSTSITVTVDAFFPGPDEYRTAVIARHVTTGCNPCAVLEPIKIAPAEAHTGSVISYTIVLNSNVPVAPGQFMADPLPAGVEFAGNLTWTAGMAWYSPTANTVFWTSDNLPVCKVALIPSDEPENGELHNTLDELGYSWVNVTNTQQARDARANVIIDRYDAPTLPAGDIAAWLSAGNGYVQIGDWPDWFANNWASATSGTPLTITVADTGHPLTRGLPGSWTGLGFYAYGWEESDAVAWATDAGLPNLIEVSYGTVHQRALTGVDVGPGRAVFIGFNTYGTLAGASDRLVMQNALNWSGRCRARVGAAPPAGTTVAAAPPGGYIPAPAADVVDPAEPPSYASAAAGPTYTWPQAMLWDNGPLVTYPGACGGADASRLQNTSLGMSTYGVNDSAAGGFRVADDFTVTAQFGWEVTGITFFAYQANAPTSPSPITAVNYRIWDGMPGAPGSSVVWGDTITNRLLSSTWANIHRDAETAACSVARPIVADVASAGARLAPGHYWLDWQTGGSAIYSGPWAPPITILGQVTTGDAWQYGPDGLWDPVVDTASSARQGMPFIIEGNVLPPPMVTFDVTVTAPCGTVVNEGIAACGAVTAPFAAATDIRGGEGDIVVDAPLLWAELCPTSTEVMTFTICNLGDCVLWWTIAEMTGTLLADSSDPFVPVDVVGQGGNPGLTTVSPPAQLVAVPAVAPEDVLWDQPLSTISQSAWIDQEFPDYPAYSSFLADDFANTDAWLVSSFFVPGNMFAGTTADLISATALTWQIYASIDGLPGGDPHGGGNPPAWTLTLPPDDPQVVITTGSGGDLSDVQLNLAAPGLLPPGHWWLVFYPTAPFGSFGQYGRQPADTTNGYVGQAINPGGGFGKGTEWQDWMTWPGGLTQDIAFRIEGVVVDVPWVSEDPYRGGVPAGECRPVAVTFDSTGLPPADYFADLLVFSDDPDTQIVTLPVTMTVKDAASCVCDPVFGANFTWLPNMPGIGQPIAFTGSTTGGTPPITYAWTFDDGGTGTGSPIGHTYAVTGTYTVVMTATNACGSGVATHDVTVSTTPGLYYIYLPVVFNAAP